MFEQELDDEPINLGEKQVSMNPEVTLRMEVKVSVLRCLNMN